MLWMAMGIGVLRTRCNGHLILYLWRKCRNIVISRQTSNFRINILHRYPVNEEEWFRRVQESRKARQAYEDLLKDLEVAEGLFEDLEAAASSPELELEQFSLQNQTAALVAELDTLDHNLVARLPGCYPLVMPFASSVTAAKWKLLAGSGDPFEDSSSHELASNVSFEAQADFSLFISIIEAVEGINAGMQNNHNYSQCGKTQMLGMIGSYLGVSLRKDVGIAQCEVKESLPSCWQDFMIYLTNNTATGQEFPYENLTVDSLFFDYEDYALTLGDYNLTLEKFDLDYNITETAYAKIESLTGMTNSLAEYKDNVVEKLRSEYDEVLKARTVPEQVSSGFSFDLYSPDMETVNMLRRRRMIGTSMEREATTVAPTSSSDQLWDECKLVNTSNIQHCWEKMIAVSFEQMDSEHINSYLAMADLALISYSTTIMVALAQAVQMLSLASFFVATPLINQLYGEEDEDRHPVNRLTCIYDIIMEKELEFDASFEVGVGGKSILKTLVSPFSRDNFATYPYRLLNTTTLILIHREELVQGLTNITAAIVEKLSAIIEEGDLAHKIAGQSDDMRDWLLGIDVVKVLESFVELTKAAFHASHRLRSGNWPELVAVLEEMVQLAQSEGFWKSMTEMVEGVVGKRWQSLDFIMSWAVEPAIRNLVEGLEWLAEDVAEHLSEAAQMIRQCDDSWLVDHYGGGWGRVARDNLCGDDLQPEVIFHNFFTSAIERISMVEPSFSLLSPDGTCALFNSCNLEVESELRNRVERSGLSEAFNAIFR